MEILMKKSRKLKYVNHFQDFEDFGYVSHVAYLSQLFGVVPPTSIQNDYMMISENFGSPDYDSVWMATHYLYTYYVMEVSRELQDKSEDGLFIFISKLITSLTLLQSSQNTQSTTISAIKYNKLFELLKSFELRAIVGSGRNPSIKIMNMKGKNLIFQVRLKKENTVVDGQLSMDVLFETGELMETVLQSTETV